MAPTLLLMLACALPSGDETPTYREGDWVVVIHWNAHVKRDDGSRTSVELGEAFRIGTTDEDWLHVPEKDFWIREQDVCRHEDAESHFTTQIKQNPTSALAHFNRGVFYKKWKRIKNAAADMDQAVSLAPDEPSIRIGRGIVRLSQKEYLRAIIDFDVALKKNPYDAAAWNGRGIAHMELRQYDKAIADYTESINLQPGHSYTWSNRAKSRSATGDGRGALTDHDEAVRLAPRDPDPLRFRSRDRWKSYDRKGALEDLTAAIGLARKDATLYRERAERYQQLGLYHEALGSFTLEAQSDPLKHGAYASRAWILATCPVAEHRNGQLAVTNAEIACAMTNYKEPVYLSLLAAAYAEKGDFTQALKWQRSAIDLTSAAAQKEKLQNILSLYEQERPFHAPMPLRLRPPVEAPR